MIVVIILVVLIVGIAILANNDESRVPKAEERANALRRLNELESFKIEAPNQIRIFQDSLRLIQNTNNIDTFIIRCSDLENSLNWIASKVAIGMPIELSKPPLIMRLECFICINENALRLVKAQYEKWNSIEHKAGKRFDNATIKTFNVIDSLLGVLKTGDNKDAIKAKIEQIRNNVEDVYSNIK